MRLARSSVLALLALSGCTGEGILQPRGPVADANRLILLDSLGIMLAIVIPTLIAIFAFAWWFRASNPRATYRPDFVFSARIETIVWGIPALVVAFLAGLIWIGSHRVDPRAAIAAKAPPLDIQVIALDWKWLFLYPRDGVASVNRLVVPVGRPLHLTITSASVMNSFFVPQLGSQIYAMNGMASQLNLMAGSPGRYRGESAHFSGDGFSGMQFAVEALPPADYDRWLAATRGHAPMLDARGYAALARQSSDVKPITYGGLRAGLFDAVVRQQLPPSEGPKVGRGGPHLSPERPR